MREKPDGWYSDRKKKNKLHSVVPGKSHDDDDNDDDDDDASYIDFQVLSTSVLDVNGLAVLRYEFGFAQRR